MGSIVILEGSGTRGGRYEHIELSEKLAFPVSVTLQGHRCIPDDHNCLGGLGLIGTKPIQEAM